MAEARTESSGLSRIVLAIAGLVALALCVAGILVLYDPHGGPNLLASIYDALGNSSGATALRNGQGDLFLAKILLAVIALAVGVGGIWLLFIGVGGAVSLLQPKWRDRILPWVFVGPALALLAVFLVYPAAGTIIRAFMDDKGQATLGNFQAMSDPEFLVILRNNAIWLIVGTGGSVLLGLIIAGLFDRIRREALAKTIVFLPLAISLVGASVIWTFVYAWQPAGQPQIGLLNSIVVALGGQPISWLTTSPINVFAEIIIMIWLQTGFAMVVLSAAIKGVSGEVIEAARLDGASERQLFFRVIVPMIRGSIITVSTTIAIVTLKIFDIVYVTTGGRFNDDVVANRMFHDMFQFFDDGAGAALATLLFVAVLPVMYINLRNFRRQQAQA
ncbi:MAG TPA: sugar ABC transporter permease [Candidatus Limnocylindrales bacterium]|jgi:alpha-glucoside transport system permease protein